MESEADLDEEIKHLLTLTEVPDLYPQIVQLGAVTSIVSLLSHENTDITIDAIELLNELTDEDVVAEHEEDAIKIFIDALVILLFFIRYDCFGANYIFWNMIIKTSFYFY